jgi:methylthioxylose transferase
LKLSPSSRKFLLGFLVASSFLLCLLILGDWLPWLRGPAPETSEWYWPYALRPVQRLWPALAAAILTLTVGTLWIYQGENRRAQTAIALVCLFICSLFLQTTFIYADRPDVPAELVDRTLSNLASGFFEPAAEISDMNQVLANYPQVMPNFISEHARTHPPGLILANWVTIQSFTRIEWLSDLIASYVQPLRCMDLWLYGRPAAVSAALGVWAILPLLFAAGTVFPAYGLARHLLQGYTIQLATIMASTLPALILFAPKSVQLYAPMTLFMFWAFHAGLTQNSAWKLFLAGLIGSIMTFFSLGNAALFLLLALYAVFILFWSTREVEMEPLWPQDAGRITGQIFAFFAGAVSIWLVYTILWGVPPWEIAISGLYQHYQLVTNIRRYEWWVVWNLIDLVLFTGWPLFLGYLGSLLLAFRFWRKGELGAVDALAIVLLVVILLLNFSGSARGEVGRLWLFFMPLLAFPAANFWRNTLPEKRDAVLILALQLLLILSLGLAWRPVRSVIVVAEPPVMTSESPQASVGETFATEPLQLSGYSLSSTSVLPGDNLELTLFWQAGGPASRPYTVFNHLINEDGVLVAQQDNWPVNGLWPPTCWRTGDEVVDTHSIAIPADAKAGTYHLLSGLYDRDNGIRVPLEDGRDGIELTTIEIQAP